MTSSSRSTTCGRAADSAASTNLLTDSTTSAAAKNPGPSLSIATRAATPTTNADRIRLTLTSTRWRLHRSSSTPANGPTSEYGKSSTANAAAAFGAVVAFDGSKNT